MKLGILTAMSVEYNQLSAMMTNCNVVAHKDESYLEGRIGDLDVVLLQCGIGKVNAAVGVTLLIDRMHPDAILSTGVAGGVDECLHVMDVVVSRQTVYHDTWCGPGNVWGQVQGFPERFEGDAHLLKAASGLESDVTIHEGLICTGDLFVSNLEEQQLIKRRFPDALAVDMESAAIAQVCYLKKVPFVSFRIISDTPGHKDNISQYEDFWKTLATQSFSVTRAYIYNII